MRTLLVCGSRTWTDREMIRGVLERWKEANVEYGTPWLIHGGARGADKIAAEEALGLRYSVQAFGITPEDWKRYGKRAGAIRNARMLREGKPDAVAAFWDGRSAGTLDMIQRVLEAKDPIPFRVFTDRVKFP